MATDPLVQAGANTRKFFGSDTFRNAVAVARGSTGQDLRSNIPLENIPAVAYQMQHLIPAAGRFFEGLFGTTPQEAPARAAAAPAARPVAKPAAAPTVKSDTQVDPRAPVGAPTFDQMLAAYAGQKGGNISLREMGALADIANKTATRQRLPSIADIAGQKALDLGDQMLRYKTQQAIAAGDKNAYYKAIQEYQDTAERLARARAIDPMTAYGLDEGQ